MTRTIPPAKRIELLLNTLQGERHFRRTLLTELVDELDSEGDSTDALRAGRALLRRLDDGIGEPEYELRLGLFVALARCSRERRDAVDAVA